MNTLPGEPELNGSELNCVILPIQVINDGLLLLK